MSAKVANDGLMIIIIIVFIWIAVCQANHDFFFFQESELIGIVDFMIENKIFNEFNRISSDKELANEHFEFLIGLVFDSINDRVNMVQVVMLFQDHSVRVRS